MLFPVPLGLATAFLLKMLSKLNMLLNCCFWRDPEFMVDIMLLSRLAVELLGAIWMVSEMMGCVRRERMRKRM